LWEREEWVVFLHCPKDLDPVRDSLRSNPRFQELPRHLGLPNQRDFSSGLIEVVNGNSKKIT